MQINNSHFSNLAKLFHWLIAGLIVSQYGLAKLAEYADQQGRPLEQLAILANHKSIGITILVLAVARLLYRLYNKPPALPDVLPKWQKHASAVSHFLLYGLLFALPLSGWLMSSAKAFSVSWFNLFAVPDLVGPSDSLAEQMHSAHHFLAEALFIVALIHILAALKHHFLDKDDVLTRMADKRHWIIFTATIVLAIGLYGRFFNETNNMATTATQQSRQITLTGSDLPLWSIDYADSFIKFSGEQAGAPFSGEWQDWSADIQFQKDQLDRSRFNVSIKSESVFSNDKDRDDTIRSADFFDALKFPASQYLADDFAKATVGFTANGQLTMKGFSSPTILDFTVEEKQGKLILTGTATLDRLTWSLGIGDWADTSWIGQHVIVEVRVVASSFTN